MHILAVLGSPRAEGGSATVARRVLQGAEAAGHTATVLSLNEMDVRGCQACRRCKTERVDCVQPDALAAYWPQLHACDALLLAACNYMGMVNGPMVTFMNRHYCLTDADGVSRLPAGKKLVGVFSQGQPDTARYREVYDWYLGPFVRSGMTLVDVLVHAQRGPQEERVAVLERAYAVGRGL